ncbi:MULTISPECIES: hypothetical protein [unclassified Nostoc]|uniref:hypothetical protein n=1 Tax=unclassified Nostoc TaxID=2593658 RepID=UPI002AD527F3|nr:MULTISPECIES: hypothetical protein [unclassified Nostoc]MDZ8121731.1 hypothetical protein [Nostoc sp. CmiVER01]MDZ8225993.1 hypothetical protein [Nostoc sp. ChiVER01]
MDSNSRLEYLYKEYVRLSEKAEEYIKSAFEDLKLMGVIGATIALWKPIVDAIVLANPKIDQSGILFLGFLSLLLVVAIIGFWNLIKQSFIIFFADNLQGYEEEIRKELNEADYSRVFNFNLEKETKLIESYRTTFAAFIIVFAIATTFIPFIILFYTNAYYAFVYILLSLTIFGSYFQVLKKSTRKYFSIKK